MFKNFTNNQRVLLLKWGNLLCIFSLTFLLFYLYTKNSIYWDIFTSRDIHRALGWLEGQFHWPGPEMSGGNNLPGPFFYFLLFPPLIFGENIYHQSLLWYISWLALTYTIAFSFLEKIIKHKESFLMFLITFITAIGYPLFRPLYFAWNPGFAILFHILALIGLYYWRETNKNLYLYLVGLVIALGIQVHLFVSVHIITVFLFYLFDLFKKKKNILPFLLLLFLVSFPVLLYNAMNYLHIFETSTLYPGYFIYLKNHIHLERWLNNIKNILDFSIIDALFFTLFLIFWKKWKIGKWLITKSTRNLFIITAIPCVIAVLGAREDWYIYFIPIFIILLLSKSFDDLISDHPDKKQNLVLVYAFILTCPILLFSNAKDLLSLNNLLYAMDSYHVILLSTLLISFLAINTKWTYKSLWKICMFLTFLLIIGQVKIIKNLSPWKPFIGKSFSRTLPRYQDLYPLTEKIYLETNWSAKKAIKHIHIVGIHPEVSILSHYAMTKETIKKKNYNKFKGDSIYSNLKRSSEKPDGYMIIQHLKKFTNYSKKDWKKYLSHSSLLSNFLRQEIIEGKILIKAPELYRYYWLIPYNITKESMFVEGFYNIGQPYYWEEPKWLKSCDSTKQFKDKDGFYYCMVLPGYMRRAGVHIRFSENIYTNTLPLPPLNLDINFSGPLIGSSDCCSNTIDYNLWLNIQIDLLCNKTYYKYDIPNIGDNFLMVKKNPQFNGQWLTAPLKLRIPIKNFKKLSDKSSVLQTSSCKKKDIKSIKLIFTHLYKEKWLRRMSSKKTIKVIWER